MYSTKKFTYITQPFKALLSGTYTISFTTFPTHIISNHNISQFLHFTSSHIRLHPNATQQHHSSNSSPTCISTQQFTPSRVQHLHFISTLFTSSQCTQQHHSSNSPKMYTFISTLQFTPLRVQLLYSISSHTLFYHATHYSIVPSIHRSYISSQPFSS